MKLSRAVLDGERWRPDQFRPRPLRDRRRFRKRPHPDDPDTLGLTHLPGFELDDDLDPGALGRLFPRLIRPRQLLNAEPPLVLVQTVVRTKPERRALDDLPRTLVRELVAPATEVQRLTFVNNSGPLTLGYCSNTCYRCNSRRR